MGNRSDEEALREMVLRQHDERRRHFGREMGLVRECLEESGTFEIRGVDGFCGFRSFFGCFRLLLRDFSSESSSDLYSKGMTAVGEKKQLEMNQLYHD